jgi:hypothetical protein
MTFTQQQTELLVVHVLELHERGFPPWAAGIEDLANTFRAEKRRDPVGPCWAKDFVKRRPELPVKFSARYNHDSRNEVETISRWFTIVENTKKKYKIQDHDMYSFDECLCDMGPPFRGAFSTGSEQRRHPNMRRGNRKWVTVLHALNADGWTIPPFLVSARAHPLSLRDHEADVPPTWGVAVSDNGFTTDQAAISWLEHFETHTRHRSAGAYRLLIMDNHESHNSYQFQRLCQEKNIITICTPQYYSRYLQPINIGYFPWLRKAYQGTLDQLRNKRIQIRPEMFLPTFVAALQSTMEEHDICASFKDAGLVPHNPDAVLSRCPLIRAAPTKLAQEDLSLETIFPNRASRDELQTRASLNLTRQSQTTSLPSQTESDCVRIRRALEQSFESLNQIMKNHEALVTAVANLEKSTRLTTRRSNRRKKAPPPLHAVSSTPISTASRGPRVQKAAKNHGRRRCRGCGRAGHNIRKCNAEVVNATGSD